MLKEGNMAELQDYSGEFRPNLKLEEFSKDALLRLWQAGGKLYLGIDGIWYRLITERFSEQMALELDQEVWMRNVQPELYMLMEAMHIHGNDVATLFKVFQVDPNGSILHDMHFELKNKNEGILTVTRCSALDWAERHGDAARAKSVCDMDVPWYSEAARLVNPRMKAIPLDMPSEFPRKVRGEYACKWEFKVEE